jgi:hypothetical protein
MDKDLLRSDRKLIRGIVRHMVEYPDAKDTAEGIRKWWRPTGEPEWGENDVQMALDFLISKGWLTKRQTTPSKEIYVINRDSAQEIKNFCDLSKDEEK